MDTCGPVTTTWRYSQLVTLCSYQRTFHPLWPVAYWHLVYTTTISTPTVPVVVATYSDCRQIISLAFICQTSLSNTHSRIRLSTSDRYLSTILRCDSRQYPSHRESSHTVDFGGQNRCATQSISTLQYSDLCCAQSTQEPDHNSPIRGLHSRKPHSKDCASCEDPPRKGISWQFLYIWRDVVTVMARYIQVNLIVTVPAGAVDNTAGLKITLFLWQSALHTFSRVLTNYPSRFIEKIRSIG